jgi:hypothetical protein
MKSRSLSALCGGLAAAFLTLQTSGLAQAKKPAGPGGAQSITPAEVNEYLSYIASDELQGRQIFTEGPAGRSASPITREWT